MVTGVAYRTPDGAERRAAADLTVACDGMYSSLRAKLTVTQARRTLNPRSYTLTPCGACPLVLPLKTAVLRNVSHCSGSAGHCRWSAAKTRVCCC